jgi:hypothetical protein
LACGGVKYDDEAARERRLNEGRSIRHAAVVAARALFRAILITSFAFVISPKRKGPSRTPA